MKTIKSSFIITLAIILNGCSNTNPNWQSIRLKNNLIELEVVPEIGGRVIQYKLGDYGFFLLNEKLKERKPPESGLGPNGQWLNYGGDKLWPAPQGWNNENQWPGPPDAVLDGGKYDAKIIQSKTGKPIAVKLTSQTNAQSGIQLSRTIKIFDASTRVSIDAQMKNVDNKPRRWGIWSHTQFNAKNRYGKGFNQNYHAYCSINPNSIFPKGYDVIFGIAQNPSFKPDYKKSVMDVHYHRLVGKIGMDSSAGWIATVDGTDGMVFVQRFTFQQGKEYPDNSSVEFWTDGHGQIYAYNKLMTMPEDCGYGFESEIIGPYEKLNPSETADFHYEWYAATIGGNYQISDCSSYGVTCEKFSAALENNDLKIHGRYGIFYEGSVQLQLKDESATVVAKSKTSIPVSPLKPLVLENTKLAEGIDFNNKAVEAVIVIRDVNGKTLGELAKTNLK